MKFRTARRMLAPLLATALATGLAGCAGVDSGYEVRSTTESVTFSPGRN